MQDFVNILAQAIAHAPSLDEARRLWDTNRADMRPSVGEVLRHALNVGNETAIIACGEKAKTKRRHVPDLTEALRSWRRSPGQAWHLSPEQEQAIGGRLIQEGLISPDSQIKIEAKGMGDNAFDIYGPMSWCAEKFLPHAATGILDACANPNPNDMARALIVCIDRLSSARRDEAPWMMLLETLLDKGADPNLASSYRRPMGLFKARDAIIAQPHSWSERPFDLVARLTGSLDGGFTEENIHGHTPFLQWILSDGDEAIALRLAQGQALSVPAMEKLLERYVATTKKRDTTFFEMTQRSLELPSIQAEEAVGILMSICNSFLTRNERNDSDRVLYKAGAMTCRCAPEIDQENLLGLWDGMVGILKQAKPSSDPHRPQLQPQLQSHVDAWLMARATPHANAPRPGIRL